MKTEFDVVVVGAGINGILCGAYLQKAGLDVAVIERRNECGPYCLTEEPFGAGIPVDTHAVMVFAEFSPAWKELELDRFGVEILYPDPFLGASWKDGKNHLLYLDPQKTAQAMAKHSEKDAQTYLRIVGKIFPEVIPVMELLQFSVPSEDKLDLLWEMGRFADMSRSDLMSMNGFEFYDLLYESEHVKMGLMASASAGQFGDPSVKGEGAFNCLFFHYYPPGVVKGGVHNLVHSLVRCFKFHGGTLLLNAPVERVFKEGGRARGVILSEEAPYPEKEIRARHAVVMHVSPPVALELLGEETVKAVDLKLWRKMKDWEMTGHAAFTSFFLLRRPFRWKSEDWNPDIKNNPFIYRAWDSWDHAQRYFQYYKNEDVWKIAGDVGETFFPGVTDPQQVTPEGYCVFNFEMEYPVNLRRYGGPKTWDDKSFCGRLHEINIEVFEELAPGFKDLIIDSFYLTPLDNWRRNPSAIWGHEQCGDISIGADQWYTGRMPQRFPIPHLYFSQGTWPAGYTALNSGYVAATVVAEDLGLRNKDWWVSRPLEHWMQKIMGRR